MLPLQARGARGMPEMIGAAIAVLFGLFMMAVVGLI
jgi:hypothetical protein